MPLNELTQELNILTHYENGFFQQPEFQRTQPYPILELPRCEKVLLDLAHIPTSCCVWESSGSKKKDE